MTASEVAKLVAMLMQAFPQAQFGPASSALYERELADLDQAAALAAVRRLIRTSRFMPTIAEIREAATELMQGPRRLGGEAFGDLLDAIRRVGSYRPPPAFADPLVGECVRLMGWGNLCQGENEAADRAQFIRLYEGLQDRARDAAGSGLPLPAPGSGYALATPVRALLAGVRAVPSESPAEPVSEQVQQRAPTPRPSPVRRAVTASELDALLGAGGK